MSFLNRQMFGNSRGVGQIPEGHSHPTAAVIFPITLHNVKQCKRAVGREVKSWFNYWILEESVHKTMAYNSNSVVKDMMR